jgi:NAD(P)-dependent dehydrogenase (short-subunit alcohol dehydrogenase family)
MKRFDNRTGIVAGGAPGMGASHARGFVAEGANVVIADVLAATLKRKEAIFDIRAANVVRSDRSRLRANGW